MVSNTSESDREIRKYLVWLLRSGDAHMTLDDAIAEFPMDQINVIFPRSTYSFWGALEHVRRTQADILDFIKNPNYQERDWPREFWPEKGTLAKKTDWQKTIKEYKKDLDELIKIIKDPKTKLFENIPWGNGETIFREVLLAADHTSYEIGEIATMRRVFGHWDITHP